ncbi:MAG: hypothetical protein NVSMB23_06760 [Myxococcales bacterium]
MLLSLGALAFDLGAPALLPDDAAWAGAAAALRARVRPGDAVQIWPPWAERARLFVDAAPVLAEEDLRAADYVGVSRLWVLALTGAPHADPAAADTALRARGAQAEGEPLRFRGLSLRAYRQLGPQLAADLIFAGRPEEAHEVDFVARRCVEVQVGSLARPARVALRGAAGAAFHLRAGLIGERAFDDKAPVELRALAAGVPVVALSVPHARLRQAGWIAADAPLPPGPDERAFDLLIASADPAGRPLCVAAWTTR